MFEKRGLIWLPFDDWESKKYEVKNNEDKKVEETVAGKFAQFPLALGYAITVHKSQGKTFEKINVDKHCNANDGQLYVAISRATSVEGVYLENYALMPKTSKEVKDYYFQTLDIPAQSKQVSQPQQAQYPTRRAVPYRQAVSGQKTGKTASMPCQTPRRYVRQSV